MAVSQIFCENRLPMVLKSNNPVNTHNSIVTVFAGIIRPSYPPLIATTEITGKLMMTEMTSSFHICDAFSSRPGHTLLGGRIPLKIKI